MLGDPDLFPIEHLRPMGMWPQVTMTSRGIIPYIKRIKSDKVKITIVGDSKGDSIVDILESCPNVFRIYAINKEDTKYSKLFEQNIQNFKNKIKFLSDRESDVVCIDGSMCSPEALESFYDLVKPNGIFCGNCHEDVSVKDALNTFRRNKRIGTPIQVSNRTVWFWYKRG